MYFQPVLCQHARLLATFVGQGIVCLPLPAGFGIANRLTVPEQGEYITLG